MLVSAVLLLGLGVGVYWGVGRLQTDQRVKELLGSDYDDRDRGEEVLFAVPVGADGARIADLLLEKQIIESRKAFVRACEADGRCEGIQPGAYPLYRHSSARSVVGVLVDPKNKQQGRFTVREGLTVIQTLQRLADQTNIPLADFQEAIKDREALGITTDWYARLDGKQPATTSVEGFLFPDTYFYDPTATATDILKIMINQFFRVADEIKLRDRSVALGVSPYELLITASLAQVEAGVPEDFAKVARVVYNRVVLKKIDCLCLQFDSTANYWAELNGLPTRSSGQLTAAQLDDPNNPYNTGPSTPGLPVGPISNPGKQALLGALNPAPGPWLFFVAVDAEGHSAFAATIAEHCRNIDEAIAHGVALDRCQG